MNQLNEAFPDETDAKIQRLRDKWVHEFNENHENKFESLPEVKKKHFTKLKSF